MRTSILTLAALTLGACSREPDKCFVAKPVEADISTNGVTRHYTKPDFPIKMSSNTTYVISNAKYETAEEPCHEN
jgi:hypothetical protein